MQIDIKKTIIIKMDENDVQVLNNLLNMCDIGKYQRAYKYSKKVWQFPGGLTEHEVKQVFEMIEELKEL